jgi:hypothetical protein
LNKLIGIKTEVWYHTVYDLVSHKYIRHYTVIKTNLWATKGWRRASKKKFSKVIAWHDIHPMRGYEVRWSK